MYKTILVPISTPESGRATLETALQVARKFNAHLEVLHVRPDPRGLVPYTGEGMDGSMIEEIMEVTEREGGERAHAARAAFERFCADHGLKVVGGPDQNGVTASWRESVGREDEIVAVLGRVYDLVVIGRPVRDAPLPSPVTLEAALLDTGRPTLVAPPAPLAECGTKVVIAWEDSPWAAHAIAGAMPLLEKAEGIWIIAHSGAAPPEMPPELLVDNLAWRGVRAEIRRIDGDIRELGALYLEHAGRVGADLLVKGAYSQSRIRQMILGGRTRHILGHATIPILLAH